MRSRMASATASLEDMRNVALPPTLDDHDLVLTALEADVRAGDVVEDDRVGPFALELLPGPSQAGLRFGGEADNGLTLTAAGGERGEDVLGRLEIELEAACSLAVDLLAGGAPGTEVGRGRRHHQHIGGVELAPEGVGELGGGLDVDPPHTRMAPGGRRSRRPGSPPLRAARRAPRGPGPSGPEERLPMKRTGSIGSRVPPAETSTRSPSQGPLGPGAAASSASSSARGSGSLPSPCSPAGGERTLLRLDHGDPALTQRRQVRLGRGVAVHPVVHRRSDEPGGGAGEERGGEHRVGDPGGELGDGVGRRWSDQVGVRVGDHLEVADRVVRWDGIARGTRRGSGRARTHR